MGMYDMVICEAKLPSAEKMIKPLRDFQTKSFDCELETYKIGADGKFYQLGAQDDDRVVYFPQPFDWSGQFTFYTRDNAGTYWCFRAFVSCGQISMIERIDPANILEQ